MRYPFWLLLVVLYWAVPGSAEVVLFRNGDQLSGSWQRLLDNRLVFKSDVLGEVSVPVAQLRSFVSTRDAVILLKSGEAYSGELSLVASGDWELRKNGGVRHIAAPSVVAIYPQEVYQPKGQEEVVLPWHNWHARGNLGYSLVRGDRDANTLSIGFNASRLQPDLPGMKERFRTNSFLTMLFANTTTGAGVRISANSISSGLRQDFLFTPTNFFFVIAQLDHSQTQSLDLRQTYGLGLGRDLVRGPRVRFDFLGGTTFVGEDFQTAAIRRNVEGLIGEMLSLRLSNQVTLEHFLNFYPNLTDTGEFRLDTTSTLSTRLSSRLSFNTTVINRFLSRPQPGRQKNELVLTTGLGINF